MVWLKENGRRLYKTLWKSNFNSNMVWLKAEKEMKAGIKRTKFQFQYGLIKSVTADGDTVSFKAFQFQYGLIKSLWKVQK